MLEKIFFILIFIVLNSIGAFAQKIDTLYMKRSFLSTHIYKDGVKLSNKRVIECFKDTWQPNIKYKWSRVLKPAGPLVVIGGVGLTYIAFKGVEIKTVIEGKQVNYINRDLTQLSIGVGVLVVGFTVIASSNQLARHSVDIYNSILKDSKKTSCINKIQFGLTEGKAIGFSIFFK